MLDRNAYTTFSYLARARWGFIAHHQSPRTIVDAGTALMLIMLLFGTSFIAAY